MCLLAFFIASCPAKSYNFLQQPIKLLVFLLVSGRQRPPEQEKYQQISGKPIGVGIMKLSVAKVKNANLPEGKSQVKLTDGGGLYLQVTSAGKYWRMNYRFGGKQRTLSLGVYPQVSLKEARDKRDEAKKLLERNIDPSQKKQSDRRKAGLASGEESFEAVAKEWFSKQTVKWVPTTIKNTQARLEKHIFPWIGSLPLKEIEAQDILRVVLKAEERGTIETAHRLKALCSRVFRYGIATGRVKYDPTVGLQGALQPIVTEHRATITEPRAVGELLRAIEGFEGTFVVMSALKLSPYVFLRPGELRLAQWTEFDLDAAEWRIPAERMKMKEMHIVPLSKQVLAIFKELQPLTGGGRYVFPSIRNASRPMSENTINASLRRLGYDKSEICAHGFRAMASTMLHENGWESDWIERQLAHKEGNAIKGAYNHARHLPERVKMMQWWADYLDGLREAKNIVHFRPAAGG